MYAAYELEGETGTKLKTKGSGTKTIIITR